MRLIRTEDGKLARVGEKLKRESTCYCSRCQYEISFDLHGDASCTCSGASTWTVDKNPTEGVMQCYWQGTGTLGGKSVTVRLNMYYVDVIEVTLTCNGSIVFNGQVDLADFDCGGVTVFTNDGFYQRCDASSTATVTVV